MTYQEMMENAKLSMGLYCKACPVCDGRACKNQIPGPGAKGVGDTAIRNYKKWQEIRVNMDTICDGGEADTSVNLFGKEFKMPFFAGPVGAVNLHYSDRYDDVSYNNVLVSACADAGIAAFTGDGVNAKVMEAATEAIRENDGCGIPTVKPWNLDTVREKMELVKKSGAFAIVLECVPAKLAEIISESINIPTIGIGAGSGCDGQILVYQDMLGMVSDFTPKFVKQFAKVGDVMKEAFAAYIEETKQGSFPAPEHTFKISEDVINKLY